MRRIEVKFNPDCHLIGEGYSEVRHDLINGFNEGDNQGRNLNEAMMARIRGALHAIIDTIYDFELEMPDVEIRTSETTGNPTDSNAAIK